MAVTVKCGQTAEAEYELACFIMAYPGLAMEHHEEHTVTYFIFDPTDAPMFEDMAFNEVLDIKPAT